MRKSFHGCRPLALTMLLIASACGGADHGNEQLPWFGRTRGGAVVLSRDERAAVVVSRSAGVVTVFKLDPAAAPQRLVVGRSEIDMGAGSEPWAAVIGADDDTAYVIARRAQTITRIVDLHGTSRRHGTIAVGSEPTAIAIAPSGKRLYVANWGDGTISVVTTPDFKSRYTLDLNAALAGTGVLGDVASRLGLAHPRALALTDDGDDDDSDETLYATEFFSMPMAAAEPDPVRPGYFDRNRQGFVYRIELRDQGKISAPMPIAPIMATGFADANGAMTGCFPNQLYAAAVDGDRLFVTGMCASPEGPLGPAAENVKTLLHPAVFVIDTRTDQELPELGRLLTLELERSYDAEPGSRPRMPLIPNDLAFSTPDEAAAAAPHLGCITALGADAVFCLHYDGHGRLLEIGRHNQRYVDLAPPDQRAGRLPVGIAISRMKSYALVVNDNSQILSVLDLKANAVRAVERTSVQIERAAAVRDSPANAGRRHFATGLGVWSLAGQAWASCESCHPDGLSDGVTWFFARGPRRTISTAGTYYGSERRVLLWTGNVDEVHDVEGIVRSVQGGVGAVLWHYPGNTPSTDFRITYDGNSSQPGKPASTLRNNLNGSLEELLAPLAPGDAVCNAESTSCDKAPVHEWDELDAFIQSVRAPQRPSTLDSAEVERGAGLFREGNCAGCHGGAGWTLSRAFYTPGAVNNGALPFTKPAAVSDAQLGLLRTVHYDVAPDLRSLNPPGALGTATLRRWDPGTHSTLVHLYGTEADDGYDSRKTHGNDQINCVLRAVGTYPSQVNGENHQGIVPADSPTVVNEVRDNMSTLALGATGFNMPSLVGVAAGAPYFHAGNARTLEELLDPAFVAHYRALAPGFLADTAEERRDQIRDLTAYLLSLDDDSSLESITARYDLCVPADGRID